MNKIPCKECICYAICKASKTIVPLVVKCELLAEYIQCLDDVYKIITFLQPGYYIHGSTARDQTFMRENAQKILAAATGKKLKEML